MPRKLLKGVSLFSSAGIAEAFLNDVNIKIVVANELLEERAKLYSALYKTTEMIIGDIQDQKIFDRIVKLSGNDIDLLLATPPCQGVSVAGKNRTNKDMSMDKRNYLIFKIIDFIQIKKPKYIIIENVPNFLKLKLLFNGEELTLIEILEVLFSDEYEIEAKVLDASEFGVPQKRKRAIIKIYKRGLMWTWPIKESPVTVRQAIGHLPSLKPGQRSNLLWHFARMHSPEHILYMENTPTGKSAFQNLKIFPKKRNGTRIKGYITTYRRMKWDEPAPTITIRNDAISSQCNVHPGIKLSNGTFSDPRVLTPLELMILTSLPEDWCIPQSTPENLIRRCIGESMPPLLLKKIVSNIN